MFTIALFIFIIDIPLAQLSELNTRCLWILRDSITSPEKIDSAMTYAYKAGFNKVFIQVRGRGYAFYNSKIVPRNPLLSKDNLMLSILKSLIYCFINAFLGSVRILFSASFPSMFTFPMETRMLIFYVT